MIAELLLSVSFAAITPPKPTSIAVDELLSMPGANRFEVAKFHKDEKLVQQLWERAFDEKKDMGTRWKSLTLAAQINKEKAQEPLSKALKSQEWFMRNAALVAYREVFPEKTVAIATELLKDKALVVRSAAVESLPPLMTDEVRDRLWEELHQDYNFRKKQSLWVRSLILQKLAATPRSKEASLFVRALKEPDERLHSHAIQALEKISSLKLGTKLADKKRKSEKLRALWLDWAKKNI